MALTITWAMGGVPGWTADGASVARGGRLYDNMFLETKDRPPSSIHPKYKTVRPSMHSAEHSWRCAACHGWDYKGRTEQKTGPLNGKAGTDPASLAAILADENHGHGDKRSKRDLADLAA
ncbi:MAG: hypothetical protein ACTSP0_08720, partial [Alphaproteobacteria bacterium]